MTCMLVHMCLEMFCMFNGVCSVHTSTCKSLHALILAHAYLLCVAQHSFADDLGVVG